MKIFINSAFIVLVISLPLAAQNHFKLNIEKWDRPRPIFSEYSDPMLKIEKIMEKYKTEDKQFSENKLYYYSIVYSEKEEQLLIYNDTDYLLRITVSNYEYRPIKAKWINPKLIYFEVFFNPHFGAYWIYDVENEKVVIQELQNDGAQA